MTLEAIIKTLDGTNWLANPDAFWKHQGVLSLTKLESRFLSEAAAKAISEDDAVVAANHIFAGLILDEDRFLARLQKDGVFRCSRFSYETGRLLPVVFSLLKPALKLSTKATSYLHSIANMYELAKSVRQEYCELRDWLADEREKGIKGTLVCLDLLCLKQAFGFHETSKIHLKSRHEFFFQIEELAEGFSALLALYGVEFGELTKNTEVNVRSCIEGDYFRQLNSAAHVSAFREWEVQVDRQGYRFQKLGEPGSYRLLPPSDEFQRAVEMGQIHVHMQKSIKAQDWFDPSAPTFKDVGSVTAGMLDSAGCIKLLSSPRERYRFEFPTRLAESIRSIEMFQEEIANLTQACRDQMTSLKELFAFSVLDGLSFEDLFYTSRLLQLLRSVTASKLVPELELNPAVVFQSLVPVFTKQSLSALLGNTVGNADRAIEMWTANIHGHVDIQYQPFVPVGSEFLLPMNVFANSNVYRNALHVARKRLYEDGTTDPLSGLIDRSFQRKGFHPMVSYAYPEGEVDVLVLVDGILFVIECKNSLLPTGPHEMQTSIDYVNKAAIQLSRFETRFGDPLFRSDVAKNTGFPIDEKTVLSTAIVMSNRMLMGLRVDGHPVRGCYEFEHFIDEGTLAMGNESHCYWQGATFTGHDLRRFLDDDITYQDQWACMHTYDAVYNFQSSTVSVERMYLALDELAELLGFALAKRGIAEQQECFSRFVRDFSLIDTFKDTVKRRQIEELNHNKQRLSRTARKKRELACKKKRIRKEKQQSKVKQRRRK